MVGTAAERAVQATLAARWRIYLTDHLLGEVSTVGQRLGFPRHFAAAFRERLRRRSILLDVPASRHCVADDPDDSPVLAAAVAAGVDYLVTNDAHLLRLNPYEGVQVVTIAQYHRLLEDFGLLR